MIKYAALFLLVLAVSCATTIKGKPVGRLTVEEGVRLALTKPTVIEWLQQTDAEPVYFASDRSWLIHLKDGWIRYTEYRGASGGLSVDQIAPGSDDPAVMQRLAVLKVEYEKAIRSQQR